MNTISKSQPMNTATSPEQSSSSKSLYAESSIGRLMDSHSAVFSPDLTVGETIEKLRQVVRAEFITYGYVVDASHTLIGVVVMRELLFADKSTRLSEIMLRDPFYLNADTELMEAMRLVITKHFPEYPVCDAHGKFLGKVRGQNLFQAQAVEISAQAGKMVGIEKEERLSTPWSRSFKSRHPWLQLNLLTAFLAGAVVSYFQQTIDSMVILAVFLPILAGQSGNTGCQALAVTLRGMTLGDLQKGEEKLLVSKEAFLGFLNGTFVGISAGIGMFILASIQHNPDALFLSLIVLIAMIGSCVISGISGALVPLILRKLGFDPATASSIFLTTMTDVASMGIFLGLATILIV